MLNDLFLKNIVTRQSPLSFTTYTVAPRQHYIFHRDEHLWSTLRKLISKFKYHAPHHFSDKLYKSYFSEPIYIQTIFSFAVFHLTKWFYRIEIEILIFLNILTGGQRNFFHPCANLISRTEQYCISQALYKTNFSVNMKNSTTWGNLIPLSFDKFCWTITESFY